MKNLYPVSILLLCILCTSSIFSQVQTTGNWNANNTQLSIVYTDDDNGDGIGDGAIYVKSLSTDTDQGATFTFDGTMTLNESISISTYNYNTRVSYVRFNLQLYNLTDDVVLATTSPYISIVGTPQNPLPVNTILNYTAISTDVGDELQVRYVRVTPFDTYREFAIDNLKLNGTFVSIDLSQSCPFTLTPDLALLSSNATIEAEINLAVSRFSDRYLGTSAPSASNLATAESSYDALNISESGGVITGDPITSFSTASFLRTFAQHLKFNPGDTAIQEKANNTVWWVSKQFCTGDLARDLQKYSYEDFARPASLLKDFLDEDVKDLFAYTLYVHSEYYEHYWEATYDAAYQETNGTIDTDLVYNILDAMMAYVTWQDTADERYRYMRGFQRYLERFFSYTEGTTDGIKPDGSGFHHWTAYNNYMYAYKSAANLLTDLSNTSFQVNTDSYQVFRNAVYHQYMQSNDDYIQALATAGRKPEARTNTFNQYSLKILAIEGGNILGLSTADPILAGLYNRLHGVEPSFNYNEVTPFESGFFQLNHAHASVFRKNNWLAYNKGFSTNMWGSEIYPSNNRYGRYQSYGALEIVYPGDKETGNGYDVDTWNWNFNPGTTVIELPWENLHAERGRIDEMQQKRFVGAVNFKNKNSDLLQVHHGNYGLFAMDFQEQEGQGFSTTHSGENHNDTFTFKKSNFYFDDIIVCLGSGISNDDASNTTLTTLYQRLDNTGNGVYVNGTEYATTGGNTFNGASNNWLLSNFNTGFYLLPGSHSLKVKKEIQQTPNYNQIWSQDIELGNATDTYYTGYIDHGTNPSNVGYEYILKPSSSVSEMQTLDTEIQGGNKPYTVHQQDANAHIVEHNTKNIWGYAFFNSAASLAYDLITDVNASCLVMTEYDAIAETLLISLSNPDLGFESRSYAASIAATKQLTIQGEWHFASTNTAVTIISSSAIETVIEFNTLDGLSYEVLLKEGAETCGAMTTFTGGSWDNGTPTNTSKTIISEDYHSLSGNINACSIEIKSNVEVTIADGAYVKVEEDIIVNGDMVVENGGSVVQVNSDAFTLNNGTIQVIKTTPVLNDVDFSILGSPMTGETRAGAYAAAAIVRNHSTANFVPYANGTPAADNWADDNGDNWLTHTGLLIPGTGYLVKPILTGGGGPAAFSSTYATGTLTSGNVEFTPVMNAGGTTVSPNILSNPYASGVDVDAFLTANTNAGGAVYFWEHNTAPNIGYPGYSAANYNMEDISYHNGTIGTAANSGGIAPADAIPSGQGFGIKPTTTATITFTNAMRVTDNTGYRNSEQLDVLRLKVTNATYELQGNMALGFTEETSNAIERSDIKRLATSISLFSVVEDMELGIQMRSAFTEDQFIPLGFHSFVEEEQEYTISINSLEGELINQATVYLIDNLLNTTTNLSETEYSFTANVGYQTNRFVLVFETEPILSTEDLERSIAIYPNPFNSEVNINSVVSPIESVIVYDLQGREVKQWKGETIPSLQIDLSGLKTSVYLVKIETTQGSITQRLLKW